MNDEIIIYVKRDEQGSIIEISSNLFIDDFNGWEQIDEWKDGQDRYLYAHADNDDYVLEKHGKPLLDENKKPNFHDNWIEWTDEEKTEKYPPIKKQPTEQDLINADIYLQLAQLQMSNIKTMSIMPMSTSPRYDILKQYYDMGIYDNENMVVFVNCGWISEDEYIKVTGIAYDHN